jgi:hypothetical protein
MFMGVFNTDLLLLGETAARPRRIEGEAFAWLSEEGIKVYGVGNRLFEGHSAWTSDWEAS